MSNKTKKQTPKAKVIIPLEEILLEPTNLLHLDKLCDQVRMPNGEVMSARFLQKLLGNQKLVDLYTQEIEKLNERTRNNNQS